MKKWTSLLIEFLLMVAATACGLALGVGIWLLLV